MATRALIKRTINPTYEELGALLIAVGTEMMLYNVDAYRAFDGSVHAKDRLVNKMMENGIDGERAQKLISGLAFEDVFTYVDLK